MTQFPRRPGRRGLPQVPRPPAKTREVFEYLKKCAGEKRVINYGELAKKVGLANMGTAHPLYYIWKKCERRGLPRLNAIAVNVRTGRPGDGCPELPGAWEDVRDDVFAYDWSLVSFDDC